MCLKIHLDTENIFYLVVTEYVLNSLNVWYVSFEYKVGHSFLTQPFVSCIHHRFVSANMLVSLHFSSKPMEY